MSSIDLFRGSQSDMASNSSNKSSYKQRKSTTFLLPPVDQHCSETSDSIGELNYSNSSNSMRRRLSKLKLVKELSTPSSLRLANSKTTNSNKSKDSNGSNKVKSSNAKEKQDEQEEFLFARLNTPKVFNYFTSNFSSSSTMNLNCPQQQHHLAPRVNFDLESSNGFAASSRRDDNEPSAARKDSNTTLPKLALVSKENLFTHHTTWFPSVSPSSSSSSPNGPSKAKVFTQHSKNLFFPLLVHNSSSSSSKLSDSNQNELTNKGFYFMQSMSFINTNKQIL